MSPDGKPGVEITGELLRSAREQALRIVSANLDEARTEHPLDIPQVFEHDRPTLNGTVTIELYRAVRLLAFREVLGSKIAAAILSMSGRSIAKRMGVCGVADLLSALDHFGMGDMRVEEQTDTRCILTIVECATCSGVPNIGEPLCHFEAGFIAGALDGVLGEHVKVVETHCWGLGDRICRYEARRQARPTGGNGAESLDQVMTLVTKAADAMENGLAVRLKNRELRRAYEQLRESERVKKDLTDMIVHDMRVPMTAVMGSIETLADLMDGRMTPREQRVLEMALSSGREVVSMIGDLLDISRIEQQKLTLKKGVTSVYAIVEKAVARVGVLAKRKFIEMQAQLEPGMPEVEADARRMVRVVENLLNNAVQHTPSGGTITVMARCHVEDRLILVSVCDNGVGIAPEYHDRIFDKFVQVESHKSRKRSSTGLGLTFCKLVTEAHGGTIWVESAPGAGSTFTFSLPLE